MVAIALFLTWKVLFKMKYKKIHKYHCTASFDLLDPGNVVYHPNYLVLCDRARTEALAQSGYSFQELWGDGYALALRRNVSEYFKPICMGPPLLILTTTEEATGTSLKIRQRILLEEGNQHLVQNYFRDQSSFCDEPRGIDKSIEWKNIFYEVELLLVCVQMKLIKPARIPKKLIECLDLPNKSRMED